MPIFAERRLVGTVNLEADWEYAFDLTGETVYEYAQLIGIALLEARRRIGVETVTEVESFLDFRHRLDFNLKQLREALPRETGLTPETRSSYVDQVKEVHEVVFMRRIETVDREGAPAALTLREIVTAGMKAVKWTTAGQPIETLLIKPQPENAGELLEATIDPYAGRALRFAIAQALHNVRDHGGTGDALAERPYSAMFRVADAYIGGVRNVYIAVASTCAPTKFSDLRPERVFREPIAKGQRVSLGAFLAGEALRRSGGSAYLRVDHTESHGTLVDAEFSVPTSDSSA